MLLKTSLLAAAATAVSAMTNINDWTQAAIDSGIALKALNALAVNNSRTAFRGTCNKKNVKIRQEW